MGATAIEELKAEYARLMPTAASLSRAAQQEFAAGLLSRNIGYSDQPLPSLLYPHFSAAATAARWGRLAEQLGALLDRAGRIILEHPEIYRRLRLAPEAEALIKVDPGYSSLTPINRPDGVYDGERLQFVEINTGGPAGGTNSDLLADLVLSLFPMSELSRRWTFKRRNRTGGMLAAILGCYRESGGASTEPRVAIVGWRDALNRPERQRSASEWTRQGIFTCVLDARELSYQGGRLSAHGEPIHIVNRRLPLRDFVENPEALAPLLRAYRDGSVCLVSPLRSELASHKGTMALLHDGEFRQALRTEDRALIDEVVPYTCFVDHASQKALLGERSSWVIKPGDSMGGDRVMFGADFGEGDWCGHVEHAIRSGLSWIAQKVVPVERYEIREQQGAEISSRSLFVNWNPFVLGGKYCGASVRGSEQIGINLTHGGFYLAPLELQAEPGQSIA